MDERPSVKIFCCSVREKEAAYRKKAILDPERNGSHAHDENEVKPTRLHCLHEGLKSWILINTLLEPPYVFCLSYCCTLKCNSIPNSVETNKYP